MSTYAAAGYGFTIENCITSDIVEFFDDYRLPGDIGGIMTGNYCPEDGEEEENNGWFFYIEGTQTIVNDYDDFGIKTLPPMVDNKNHDDILDKFKTKLAKDCPDLKDHLNVENGWKLTVFCEI